MTFRICSMTIGMRAARTALALLASLMLFVLPHDLAAQQRTGRPRIIVVLADALRFDDLQNPECSALRSLAERGAVGMMSCAVAGKRTGATAMLTLAAGQQVAAEPGDEAAFNDWEAVPGEHGSARAAYMRRIGPLDPKIEMESPDASRSVKHLGIAGLARRGLDTNRLGAMLAAQTPPVSTSVIGNVDTYSPDRSAALLTVDGAGVGAGTVSLLRFDNSASFGYIDDPLALVQAANEAAEKSDFVVVQTGDLGRLESARHYLSDEEFHARREAALRRLNIVVYALNATAESDGADLLLICPRPVANPRRGNAWDRLTPVIAAGPDFPAGLLSSATTRSPGLIANIDIAPTILSIFHAAPSSFPMMTGRAATTVASEALSSAEGRLAAVSRIDFISGLNESAKTMLLYPLGAFCCALLVVSLLARRYLPRQAHWFAPAFVFILSMPAAMLFAPLLIPPTLVEYGLRLLAWGLALTAGAYVAAAALRVSPVVAIMFGTLVILIGDTLMGQTLQKNSLFCTYAVSGIRFYGIGNEYLGVVIAYANLLAFCLLDERPGLIASSRRFRCVFIAIALCWAGFALLCGWPGLGANAGSLVVTAAAFGSGVMMLRGKKPSIPIVVAFTALGLAAAFVFGGVDAAVNGAHSSHNGQAILAASHGRGAGYLLEIAVRKAALNLHYLVTPAILLGIAAVVACCWIALRVTGEAVSATLSKRQWLTRSIRAIAIASVVAMLFKDSGVATVDFMAVGTLVVVLFYVVTDWGGQTIASS